VDLQKGFISGDGPFKFNNHQYSASSHISYSQSLMKLFTICKFKT
jgi:hypothetical protein